MKKKIFIFFLYFLLIIYATENILAIKNQTQISYSRKRNVIISEHIPLINMTILPDNRDMMASDSLVRTRYKLRTDEHGYIMPSKIHDKPDIVMVFIGGSSTECLFVREEDRFPYLVGRILEKETGQKINSYNSGVSGNDSRDSLNILLNKVLALRPDIVIMMHNINDIQHLIYEGVYWKEDYLINYGFYRIFKRIVKISIPSIYMHLTSIIKTVILPKFPDKLPSDEKGKIIIDKNKLNNNFRMNLEMFVNICKVSGITPVLMTQANRLKDNPDKVVKDEMREFEINSGISYREYKELLDLFNDTIRDVERDNGILIIDLSKEIPQEKEYMFDIVHFNSNGSKFVAQIISREFKKILKKGNLFSRKIK